MSTDLDLLYGSDAADPSGPLPGSVACGYIGGHEAYHTWSREQWNMQIAPMRLPIWVADPGAEPGVQALRCVDALRALGVPPHVCYWLDMEKVDVAHGAGWVDRFAGVTHEARYSCNPYDSIDRIFHWPPRAGYAVANPTGRPHLYEHPFTVATQYAFGELGQCPPGMDLSAFRPGLKFWTP